MGFADRRFIDGRQAPVEDFAFLIKFFHRRCHFFDRNLRIDAVQIIEIDMVCLQAFQGIFQGFLDDVRMGIGQDTFIRRRIGPVEFDAAFRRQDDFIAVRFQCFAQEFFVVVRRIFRAIERCRIKKGIAHIDGLGNQVHTVLPVRAFTVGTRQTHAAHTDCRYFQIFAKCSVIHVCLPLFN